MKKYKKFKIPSKKKKDTPIKIKRRRIHKKFNLVQYSLKDITQMLSPHNTTQYLIENNSSPFYFDENEEDSFDINLNLNPFISLDSGNTVLSSLIQDNYDLKNSHPEYELASTAAQSQEFQNFKLSLE